MSQRGLFYGWVVLFAAATAVAFGQGSLFSLGVFLKPLEDSMRWSRSAISVTALINWMAMGAGSLFWGALSDRFGSRPVTGPAVLRRPAGPALWGVLGDGGKALLLLRRAFGQDLPYGDPRYRPGGGYDGRGLRPRGLGARVVRRARRRRPDLRQVRRQVHAD